MFLCETQTKPVTILLYIQAQFSLELDHLLCEIWIYNSDLEKYMTKIYSSLLNTPVKFNDIFFIIQKNDIASRFVE